MRLSFLTKRGFLRDSAVLIAGTAVAQAALVLVTPIITRLYDEADVGVLGAFVGLTSMLAQLACLRYEQAIMLADEDDVPALVQLSLATSTAVALLLVVLVQFGGERLAAAFGTPRLAPWLWLLPAASFALGLFQTLQVLLSRQRKFLDQSAARIAKTSTEVTTQIGWALTAGASAVGLIMGHVGGIIVQAGWLARSAKPLARQMLRPTPPRLLWRMAKVHAGFPLFSVPAGFANTLGHQGFTLVLAILVDPRVAGLYYLAHRVLAAPTALISQSLGPAFYQRLCAKSGQPKEAQAFIASVFVGLFILAAVPLLVITVPGPWLFGLCFGPNWAQSGNMVRMVWPAYLMMFCALPITQAFFVYEKQMIGLCWQVLFVILRIGAVYLAFVWAGTDSALVAYGVVGAVMYSVVIIMALGWAGCRPGDLPNAVVNALTGLSDRIFQKETTPA
jgi:O-antigen/teichoic acid export membrane protein